MFRYPGCVRIVSDHKLVPRSGLYCESSFTARERIYSPAPADESARANGKTVQLPACRSLLPSTVNVQLESDHIIDQEDRGRANLPGIDFKDIFQVRQLSEPILFLQDLWICEDLCRSLAERSGSANLCRRSTTIASFLLILELPSSAVGG